jgi:hypothetical protein
LGVLLQVIACITSACGLVLQRATADVDQPRQYLGFAGVAFCVLSSLPDMLSYLFAPQSLLALLCCFEPLLVSTLGIWLLPGDMKTVTRHDLAALVVGVAATMACAAFAPSSSVMLKEPEAEGALQIRLLLYGCFAVPAFGLLMWEEHVAQRKHLRDHFGGGGVILPPTLAALSLAVQRLSLAVLGLALQHAEVKWTLRPWVVLHSPSAVLALIVMVVCALNCLFHVWRGTREQPPHLFMLAYCAISAALQLCQSMVVLREFREEPYLKVLCSVLLALLSLSSVAWMHAEQAARQGLHDAYGAGSDLASKGCPVEPTPTINDMPPLSGALSFIGMMRMRRAMEQTLASGKRVRFDFQPVHGPIQVM